MRIFLKGNITHLHVSVLCCENPMLAMFSYFLYSCDVVTYDNARLELLTAVMLTVQVFRNVSLCHWVFCNMWKDCSVFIFRVKLSKALQSFRLLGTAQ